MTVAMMKAPTVCRVCGELVQDFARHRDTWHRADGRPVLMGPPVTHVPVIVPGESLCTHNRCGKPRWHHVHGYNGDCPCEDCRPPGTSARPSVVRPDRPLVRFGRSVRSLLAGRGIRG